LALVCTTLVRYNDNALEALRDALYKSTTTGTTTMYYNGNQYKYVCITSDQPDTKANPNPNYEL